MSKIDSPALFDPALFWGVVSVILFCFSLCGFYENKRPRPARQNRTLFTPSLNPNALRGFVASREPVTLQGVHHCLSVISRKDAKPRRRGLRMRAKLRQTRPLPEECAGFTFIHHRACQNRPIFTPSLNPNALRGFVASRELKTLPRVNLCLSVISREDAKPRRRGLKGRAKLRQTRPLPEECVGLMRIEHRLTGTHNAHLQSSSIMHPCKIIDNERLTPNTLRGFASSREPITLPAESRCLSVISREAAKPRRWGLKMGLNRDEPFHLLRTLGFFMLLGTSITPATPL
jgi:hypothetical protein